jgi:transposase
VKKKKKWTERPVTLTQGQRKGLDKIVRSDESSHRERVRAQVLLLSADGWDREKIAQAAKTSTSTVGRVRRNYCLGGMDLAMNERPRPGGVPKLTPREEQRVIALACTDPPEGYARWSVRLLCEESANRKLIPKVSRETIRLILAEHDTKPWREKNVVHSESDT